MEPEGSLPCSQDSDTGLRPEPDKPTPHPHTLFFLRSILTLSLIYTQNSQVIHFSQMIRLRFLYIYHRFYSCYILSPSHNTFSTLIIFGVKSTNYEVPHSVVFPSPLYFLPER